MNKKKKSYSFFQKGSAIFMILTLLWLTISTPFVIAGQQELAKMEKKAEVSANLPAAEEEATDNPLGTTNEEKTPGNSFSFSEEYLHFHQDTHYVVTLLTGYNKCDNADTYHAFHGELLVPPPNQG